MLQGLKQRIYDEFNFKKQADELGVKVWQTPSFLFIVMGLVIIAAMTAVDIISSYYDSLEVLIISESSVVILLFTIGNLIIHTVEEIAVANKMKTEFVSIASHQLKTPIAEMKWEMELLTSKFAQGLNEKQKELIGEIAHSGEKMGRLVNDLLDVARIDQGQLALSKDSFNLCKLAEEVVQLQESFAKKSKTKLNLTCPNEEIAILADKRRITVALDNLISNAIKYTRDNGNVQILIEIDGKFAQVCVRDNGVGIPKVEQYKIAQKFYRSNNSRKNTTDGTGLGLYIAKNIVEQTGGKFWFNSIENAGSEFYFTLPINNKH